MNANRIAKEAEVKEILGKINNSKSIVVANYTGITVKQLQELRIAAKEKGVELKVFKNRLFKIAINQTDFKDLSDMLTGQNIYAFGMEDDISPAKILANFSKENNNVLDLKAGTYEGKVIDADGVMEVATLPSMEEALTKLALALITPLKDLSVGMNMSIEEGHIKEG